MRALPALVLFCLLALSGCISPGQPYTYLDIKFAELPTPTPAQPATNQPVTVAFAIQNTWNQSLNGVPYIVYQNTDPGVPTSGTVIVPTTLVDIPAFGSVPLAFIIPAQAPGTYTYSIILDQAQLFPERDFTDNIATFSVTFSDQDITFDSTLVPTVTDPIPSANPVNDLLSLTFYIDDVVNYVQTSPQPVPVTYTIWLNGVELGLPVTVSVLPTATTVPLGETVPTTLFSPTPVTVSLPATGSAGTFIYTIVLSTPNGYDNNLSDNVGFATFVIPASN